MIQHLKKPYHRRNVVLCKNKNRISWICEFSQFCNFSRPFPSLEGTKWPSKNSEKIQKSFCLSICLSVYLSVCLSVCRSVFLCFYLSEIPLTFWTTFILITKLKSLSVLYLSFCQSVCLSVCPSMFLSFWHPAPRVPKYWGRAKKLAGEFGWI